jgi:long-chain acyl-CoA synthetase/crotonobetaine/carnitine-CoA ligase
MSLHGIDCQQEPVPMPPDPASPEEIERREPTSEATGRDAGLREAAGLRDAFLHVTFPASLAALLDVQAQRTPEAPAVAFFQDGVELTYRALAERSARLAHGLLAQGVRKGTHVGMMLPNCEAFVVTWFALSRIGAVAVPVNTAYTDRELCTVLCDADAQFLVIDSTLLPVYRSVSGDLPLIEARAVVVAGGTAGSHDLVHLDYDAVSRDGAATFQPPEPVTNSDLMSIQYTSGTTGQPKGCLQSHLYWLMLSGVGALQRRGPHALPNERVLVTYPLYYMMAQFELLMAMQVGGTAYVARRASLEQFTSWLKRFGIHYCAMNPMVYRGLRASADDALNELRFVAAYYHRGDALRELQTRFGVTGRDIWGMTETGVGTMVPVAATRMLDAGTCGLPSPFREVSIRDAEGRELPIGREGELCVRGPGMFWGYYKRPAANRDAFHGDWFRTGDLARVDSLGYVYLVGRIKEMIKRNGENISAAEVEGVLREHPGVREAAVIAVEDPARGEEVKAYVSLREPFTRDTLPPSDLLVHCRTRLAAFKLPRYVAYVDDFPRLGSNKIDKQRLATGAEDRAASTFDVADGHWR